MKLFVHMLIIKKYNVLFLYITHFLWHYYTNIAHMISLFKYDDYVTIYDSGFISINDM